MPSPCHEGAGNTVLQCSGQYHFFSFSHFEVFLKKIRGLWLDLIQEGLTMAIKGLYQYKNRDLNFLLARRAASRGSSMAMACDGWGRIKDPDGI